MRPRDRRVPDGALGPSALRRVVAALAWLGGLAVAAYAVIALVVFIRQDRLLFYPQPVAAPAVAPAGWRLEAIRHTARDGTSLAGVLALPPVERPPLVVYFGGNAEEVTASAHEAAEAYGNRAVLMLNYRGYGESGGSPSEMTLVADALEVLDEAARRSDIDGTRVAVHGRSLGSGVAVQVAAARAVRCVVLTSPFSSAESVAADMYWWLPVRLLMRHRFDSLARARGIHVPALFLVGTQDALVRPQQSWRLADAWGGPVERRAFEGFAHNDVHEAPGYDAAVRDFLDRHC